MKPIQIIVSLAIIVAVGVAVWLFPFGDASENGGASDVVATVNGQEISRGELDTYVVQLATALQVTVPDESAASERAEFERNALEQLINERLFFAAAESSVPTPSEAAVDERLSQIVGQFESEEAYRAELESAGVTEEGLKSDIRRQLTVEAYVATLTEGQDLSVSDEEVQALYDQEIGEEGDVSFEEVEGQIRAFLEQQKTQAIVNAAIEALRAEATVDLLI